MLTSCVLPAVMRINVGMLPRRSNSVCIFTAALRRRNWAHGNSFRHRSMVVESQRVETLIEIHADRIAGVQRPRDANQDLGEIGIDPPVARLVGVGQGGARDVAAESHVVELGAKRTQARFDIAQAFAVGQLGRTPSRGTDPSRRSCATCDPRRSGLRRRRNSRSGRKLINWENTVRPKFMNHCRPPPKSFQSSLAVQIAARKKQP